MARAGATTGAPVAVVATNPNQKLQNIRAGCPDNDPLCPWGKEPLLYLPRATCPLNSELLGKVRKGWPGKGLESVNWREEGEMEGERSGQMSPNRLHDSGRGHVDFGLCELDAWEGLAAGECQGSC